MLDVSAQIAAEFAAASLCTLPACRPEPGTKSKLNFCQDTAVDFAPQPLPKWNSLSGFLAVSTEALPPAAPGEWIDRPEGM